MTNSKKLKTQDVVVYGLVSGIGLIFIYLLFFTDLVFESAAESPAHQLNAENSFNKLNTKVQTEPVEEHTSKLELYDEELREEKAETQRLLEEQEYSSKKSEHVKLNDLSKFLEEENKSDKFDAQPSAEADTQQPTQQMQSPKKSTPTKSIVHANGTPVPSPVPITTGSLHEKSIESTKRKRRADPTFGDEASSQATVTSEPATTNAPPSVETYTAVIQGEQVIKEGSRMTIRLLEKISVADCTVPLNTRLTGVVSIQGQRIIVHFSGCQKEKLPIRLSMFDLTDGNEGLYVESLNVGQELKKEALGDAVGETANSLGIPVVDKIARSAGSKKLDSPTVTLQSGTEIGLKISN